MTQGQILYTVDIVLCIDATGSMSSIINSVKAGALRFYDDLTAKMQSKDKVIDVMRVRVIAFRDYYDNSNGAMIESPFFTLPHEQDEFKRLVSKIEASGGGDEPENGLEAVSLAIKSDWSKIGDKRRQVIVVWTDASAHPLEKGDKPHNYPTDIPSNFDELTDIYEANQGYMNKNAKRIVLFAPEAYPWTEMGTNWNQAILYPSKAGDGLSEMDYGSILDLIAHSV
jgi:hypothetical protein